MMIKRIRDLDPENVPTLNQDPEFFEIFIPDRCSHKLRVPPDFIKYFDERIPEAVLIKDLKNRVWHVDLKKEKNGVFFKNGWYRFVIEKNLELGQFMVFRYCKESGSFTVRIFGRDACKVEEDQEFTKPFIRVKDEPLSDTESAPIRNFKRQCGKW
ncbi:putative B3 domain-containing protein At5g66980 [Rutidosis leptorrhynchoides]|uniref:putative B3 domain-containing protein At5g66980 n=1 Tax=Rutidosis leptorrhynchoides TaxID=125765 RepID=UPI003A998673